MLNLKKWGISVVTIAGLLGNPARVLLEHAAEADEAVHDGNQDESTQERIQLSMEGQAHLRAILNELQRNSGTPLLEGNAILLAPDGVRLAKPFHSESRNQWIERAPSCL